MKKKDLDKFKQLLILEKQEIMRHLNQLEGASNDELSQTTTGGDSVDLAAIEISQLAIQKLGNREKKLLDKIDYALRKIETGDYGVCEMCGEDIAQGRLEARPVAQLCIDCKTEMERNEKKYGEFDEGEGEGEEWESEAGSFDTES